MQKLSNRLSAVASLVKKGSHIADVGTDHGYLPTYLLKSNIAKTAVAMDINEKPLNSCKKLVTAEKLDDLIDVRLSDGLDELKQGECDTVIIAGMGGELIVKILAKCDFLNELHLILQPMTHPEIARKFLYENGYSILNDFTVSDKNHHYCVFDSKFSGEYITPTVTQCFLGNIKDFSDSEYFEHLLNYLYNKSKTTDEFSEVIKEIEGKLCLK